MNEETRVKNFHELHDTLLIPKRMSGGHHIYFRGQNNREWPIRPTVGRPPYANKDDMDIIRTWKRYAIQHIDPIPSTDWDWLAIAQHHGLATRLLDWTVNPLIAAYFAVREPGDTDAVIYCYYSTHRLTSDEQIRISPEKVQKKVAIFLPKVTIGRITQQQGVFTVHNDPKKCLTKSVKNDENLTAITIASEYRDQLLLDLNYYGINSMTLFPDLDGLSDYVNWQFKTDSVGMGRGTIF